MRRSGELGEGSFVRDRPKGPVDLVHYLKSVLLSFDVYSIILRESIRMKGH